MTNEKVIQKLMLHFFRGSLDFTLDREEIELMSWTFQQQFINRTFDSHLNKKYPVRNRFTKLFIKKIITYLEANQDIHDDFYKHLCEAINNEINFESFYYKHYILDSNVKNIITMKETNNMVVNGTTGMRTWEAALMLADWSLSNKSLLTGKRIIELGSGIGFTGITIAKFCNPKSIVLTDCHNDVLKMMSDNIEINFPDSEKVINNNITLYINSDTSIGAMNMDWNKVNQLPEDEIPDIVIGADIVYDPSILQPLCDVLQRFSRRNKQLEIYICSVIRNETTIHRFLECLHIAGFKVDYIETKPVHIQWDQGIEKCFLRLISC